MTFPAGTRINYGDLRLTLPARARPTDTGIATIGCQANELGVKPQVAPTADADIFHTLQSTRAMLNGCERWDAVEHEDVGVDEWVMEKVAGPLHVAAIEDGGIRIECDECGWRGPWRDDRRLLAGDAQHACSDPMPLPLD